MRIAHDPVGLVFFRFTVPRTERGGPSVRKGTSTQQPRSHYSNSSTCRFSYDRRDRVRIEFCFIRARVSLKTEYERRFVSAVVKRAILKKRQFHRRRFDIIAFVVNEVQRTNNGRKNDAEKLVRMERNWPNRFFEYVRYTLCTRNVRARIYTHLYTTASRTRYYRLVNDNKIRISSIVSSRTKRSPPWISCHPPRSLVSISNDCSRRFLKRPPSSRKNIAERVITTNVSYFSGLFVLKAIFVIRFSIIPLRRIRYFLFYRNTIHGQCVYTERSV